ncbi:MAG: hypothetical protein QOJ21_2928 [Solirubrobacteraceae bacterium]|nr:hypothetical protein [Solirubrobacteraceae bacterium]
MIGLRSAVPLVRAIGLVRLGLAWRRAARG